MDRHPFNHSSVRDMNHQIADIPSVIGRCEMVVKPKFVHVQVHVLNQHCGTTARLFLRCGRKRDTRSLSRCSQNHFIIFFTWICINHTEEVRSGRVDSMPCDMSLLAVSTYVIGMVLYTILWRLFCYLLILKAPIVERVEVFRHSRPVRCPTSTRRGKLLPHIRA
jgi:hypothetical protein